MRLQAKAASKPTTDSQLQADSIVARAGTDLPNILGHLFLKNSFNGEKEAGRVT